MLFRLTLGLAFGLSCTLSAQAQVQTKVADPVRFAQERDSVMQRAATIRSQTDGQITFFRTSHIATGGTRRCTKSYMTFTPLILPTGRPPKTAKALAKKHIVKYKSVGTVVEKVFHYNPQHQMVLAEYYQDGKLIRLKTRNQTQLTEFLRGDYIVKTTRKGRSHSGTTTEYFIAPRPQS